MILLNPTDAYYNEHDPFAAEWLRQLIKLNVIPPGDVDERDIRDVRPDDLEPYAQCHFFAGIGTWAYAFRRSGIPDHARIWSGSPPCQPFSSAGSQKGFDDERHLWPHFHHLIRVCRPERLFGEQVASKDGLNWVDLVQADMEGEDYAFTAFDISAAGAGAPHIRQRLLFTAYDTRLAADRLAHTAGTGLPLGRGEPDRQSRPEQEPQRLRAADGLADTSRIGSDRGWSAGASGGQQYPDNGTAVGLGDTDGPTGGWHTGGLSGAQETQREQHRHIPDRSEHAGAGALVGLVDAFCAGLEGHNRNGHDSHQSGRFNTQPPRPAAATSGSDGLADTMVNGWGEERPIRRGSVTGDRTEGNPARCGAGSSVGRLADTTGGSAAHSNAERSGEHGLQSQDGSASGQGGGRPQSEPDRLADTSREGRKGSVRSGQARSEGQSGRHDAERSRADGLADTGRDRSGSQSGHGQEAAGFPQGEREPVERADVSDGRGTGDDRCGFHGSDGTSGDAGWPCPTNGFWRTADWLFCRDGKWRPTQPSAFSLVDGPTTDLGHSSHSGIEGVGPTEAEKEALIALGYDPSIFHVHRPFPLEHKAEARVGRLRGYGNGVVEPLVQMFIEETLKVTTHG